MSYIELFPFSLTLNKVGDLKVYRTRESTPHFHKHVTSTWTSQFHTKATAFQPKKSFIANTNPSLQHKSGCVGMWRVELACRSDVLKWHITCWSDGCGWNDGSENYPQLDAEKYISWIRCFIKIFLIFSKHDSAKYSLKILSVKFTGI